MNPGGGGLVPSLCYAFRPSVPFFPPPQRISGNFWWEVSLF